jgi:hypothetical protein
MALPGLIRDRDWKLLYSLNRDGVSTKTFLNNVKSVDHTILVFQDTNGYKFGAYSGA